ncbi:MAG: ferredoxin [Fusobacteria bacterium]|nr:ferredoxin [Fusobacteriota bacterium]
MKAYVDKETCIGCENCVNECPELFEMEDDGLAVGKDLEISDDLMDSANSALDACPVEAISIK